MKLKVGIDNTFLVWFQVTNSHLYEKGVKSSKRKSEIEEYVNDVLIEHMESMEETLYGDDDSPDSGFMEE